MRGDSGATAVEYGLIIALVVTVSMVSTRSVGTYLATHWEATQSVIPNDVAPTTPSAVE